MPDHSCSWCISWSCVLQHGQHMDLYLYVPGGRASRDLFLYGTLMLCYLFLLRTKGLALCEHVRVTYGEKRPGHFTLCSCLSCGGFILSQQCCDFSLYTRTEEPVSHPSLSPCLRSLESETLVFLGGTLTHFWRCDVWMCALCIYRWVPNGVGGWLPSSEFWQPSLDHKKGLPKAVVL